MTSQLPVQEGDTLEGKFRVGALLGEGAMGAVFRAQHLALEHTVAIKFLKSTAKGEPERRFLREARIAIRLKSSHVAKVMDVGVHNGAPYIVMEYLEGEDLAALLDRAGCLTVEDAVTYVMQACEALAEAHAIGVVHRDVKPANLMLTKGAAGSPCIKVLDFGVSKAASPLGVGGTAEGRLTVTTQGMGSPLYMAPEQINDAVSVDRRADLWSIGVVLYQLLTGTTPWTGNTILVLFASMVTRPPTPISEYRPDIPPGLWAIIEQCLERDRDRRWPSVMAFSAALAPYGPRSAALMVERIASFQDLPAVEAARPTEPMPAAGEASAFGWTNGAAAPVVADGSEQGPLASASQGTLATVAARTSGAGPVPPARTSRATLGIGILALAVAVPSALYVALRSTSASPTQPVAPTALSAATADRGTTVPMVAPVTTSTSTAAHVAPPPSPGSSTAPALAAPKAAPRPLKAPPPPVAPGSRLGTDFETTRK